MGSLRRFKLGDIVPKHGLRAFVETGCGVGDSLAYASEREEFEQLLSCDIEPLMVIATVARLAADSRIMVSRMDSARFLRMVLRSELPPALIWLDAHYPGADAGLRGYDAPDIPERIRLPLAEELEILLARRNGKDVLILDDLRIIETGEYEAGPLPQDAPGDPKPGGADWIRELFAPTHEALSLKLDTGYLLLRPKK